VSRPSRWRSGKYQKQLLLTFAVALVAIVITASGVIHFGVERAMVQSNLEGNQKMLSQLRYNIDYMNDSLKNVTITQYFDSRNYPLMNAERIETFDMLTRLYSLDRFIDSSPFLHSIVMYNAVQNKYYAGGRMEMTPENDPLLAEIDRYIRGSREIPKLRLIPFRTQRADAAEPGVDLFSMFMYEGQPSEAAPSSMLVVNIRPEWLFENLNLLNTFVDNDRGTIGIMDQHGGMFYPTKANMPLQPDLRARILQEIQASGEGIGRFAESFDAGRHVVTYMEAGLNDWKLVIVQPYAALVKPVAELRVMTVVVVACFVLLALLCAFVMALRLYRPIDRLLGRIRPVPEMEQDSARPSSAVWKDELNYIEHAYNGVLTSLQSVKRDRDENRSIVRSYYARAMLLESHSLSPAGFKQRILKHQLRIAANGPYRLIALLFDQAARFRDAYAVADQKLLRFAAANIAEDVLSAALQVEVIEAREDMMVLLVSGGQQKQIEEAAVSQLARQIQETVLRYYRLSLTVAIGEECPDYRLLSGSYVRLQSMSLYRMISGLSAIITPGMVEEHERQASEATMLQLDELEKKLAEAIRTNSREQAEEWNAAAFGLLPALPLEQMMHSLMTLLMSIRHAQSQVNRNRLVAVPVDWNRYTRELTELETLADAEQLFTRLLIEIADSSSSGQQNKQRVLAETIKEMIEVRYADLNLGLQSIADTLGMTSAHVSRVFRKAESIAVHDYIREVRLRHALRLLENCDNPIADIMERVGYGNVSNFFRHFKQRYGTTPNEYRLKRSLEHHAGEQGGL